MNRRTFIHSAGATGLGLTGGLGVADADLHLRPLLGLLEDSARENLPRELVQRIRAGLGYEELLAALSLATVRNVQPYPDVGFKYHSLMVLRAINAATQQLPSGDRWLPIIWAADYFKSAQAQERTSSGWHLPLRGAISVAKASVARRALIAALDCWDRDAADAAIVNYAHAAPLDEIFPLLFLYGARDLREIGHKAIAVANAHSLLALSNPAGSEAILRSTVAALQNADAGPNPAGSDLQADRPWRRNRRRLHQIQPGWKQGRNDPAARAELRAALYQVSQEDAGAVVVTMLRQSMSPDVIWQVLFDTAAEVIVMQPNILSLHAQTTANALHYAYSACGDEQTQQLMLLQCAAFIAMFRELVGARGSDFNLEALQPVELHRSGPLGLDELYADMSAGQRVQAAGKALSYLQTGGDTEVFIAQARHQCVYYADEVHDYKFAEAVFESYARFSNAAWRYRFLSAGTAHFKIPQQHPALLIRETLELLQS
jgi:hypothetical protein